MKKIILFLMFLILFTSFGYAQTSWKNPYGDPSHETVIPFSDTSFLNPSATTYKTSNFNSFNDVLAGNLDDNPTTVELLVVDGTDVHTGFFIFNTTGGLRQNYSGFIGNYNVQFAYTLYDYDNEGIDEIIYIRDNKTSAQSDIVILNYFAGVWLTEKTYRINQHITKKTPVCYNGYCYIEDDTGRVYRYNPTTNTIDVSINLGTSSSSDMYRMTIATCNPTISSPQLLFILDSDSDGWDDYAIVPLSSFNIGSTIIYSSANGAIQEKITCNLLENGDIYMPIVIKQYAVNQGHTLCYYYNTHLQVVKFEMHKINSSGDNIIDYKTDAYYPGGSGSAGDNHYPQIGGDVSFLQVNNDSVSDYCFTYTVVIPHGSPCPYSSLTYSPATICYDSLNSSKTLIGLTYSGDGNSQWSFQSNVLDINNNGQLEIFAQGSGFYNPKTNVFGDTSELTDSTSQRAFLTFGSGCTQWYSAFNGVFYSMTSNLGTCNLTIPFNETNVTNHLPSITGISYSATAIDLSVTSTVNVSATGFDFEGDNKFWAHDCHYSSLVTNRTSEDYISTGESVSALKQRWNIPSYCNQSFTPIYNATLYLGFDAVWNTTETDCILSGADGWSRNVSNALGVSSNLITVHVILSLGEIGGYSMVGRDANKSIMWGLFIDNNGTNHLYKIDNIGTGAYSLLATSNTLPDRILVDMDVNNHQYRVRMDTNYDGIIDYTSSYYPMLNSLLYNFHDTQFFTTSVALENNTYYSLTADALKSFLDTYYVEYTDLPPFNPTPSSTTSYQCDYSTLGVGNYEIRTWITDDVHGTNYASYRTQSIYVAQSSIPPAVDCSGYSAPFCGGFCYFLDDFSTSYSIACNGWQGGNAKIPISGEMRIERTGMDELSIWTSNVKLSKIPIKSSEYDTFQIEYDFTSYDLSRVYFSVLDSLINKYIIYMYFESNNLYTVTPSTTMSLGNFSPSTSNHIKLYVDFRNQQVTYTLNGNVATSQTLSFYDIDIQDSSYYYFTPVDFNNGDLGVDNFQVQYGNINPNPPNVTYEAVHYIYNPEFFCSINWSGVAGHRFSIQNCAERGFSTTYPLESLCIPRACIQDLGSLTINWATSNIFQTIIIVVAFILLAPLLITLIRKR